MSLTSYRAAPPRDGSRRMFVGFWYRYREIWLLFRFGGDLLSHVLRRSTIGVLALNGRVRDGIGCFTSTMTTKPKKKPSESCALAGASPKLAWVTTSVLAGVLPYCSKFCVYVLLTVVFDDDPAALPNDIRDALLFLDQIKPIEQLVPVS
jgi:hypothetical protein